MASGSGARFRLKSSGVGQLLRSPRVQAELVRRAESIKAIAESIAPVGTPPDDRHPGKYKKSFKVTAKRNATTRGGRRAIATVRNTMWYAAHVEYGAEGGRGGAHHTMLQATLLAAIGWR